MSTHICIVGTVREAEEMERIIRKYVDVDVRGFKSKGIDLNLTVDSYILFHFQHVFSSCFHVGICVGGHSEQNDG